MEDRNQFGAGSVCGALAGWGWISHVQLLWGWIAPLLLSLFLHTGNLVLENLFPGTELNISSCQFCSISAFPNKAGNCFVQKSTSDAGVLCPSPSFLCFQLFLIICRGSSSVSLNGGWCSGWLWFDSAAPVQKGEVQLTEFLCIGFLLVLEISLVYQLCPRQHWIG